jgi:hypothetical protein
VQADTPGADPFARNNHSKDTTASLTARLALLVSIGYLGWRAVATLAGAHAVAGAMLLVAEAMAVIVFAARVRSARTPGIDVVVSPDAPLPDTVAVVEATGTSIDELRTTLVSLRRVAGLDRVIVVDREGSRWLQTIAERLGATVTERSVSFDDAVRGTGSSWVLVLRSGDLPMPDLVSVCAPRCSSPDAGIVQVGIEEADPTSFEHDPDGRWSLEPFEHQVVRPSLASRGSIPWYGDGPALVRRLAVVDIESPTGHMLEDSRRVGLEVIRSGRTITHVPLTLARVRGPQGLGESLVRRHDCARRAMLAISPRHLRGVGRPARTAHLLALVPFLSAAQRVLLLATAFVVLGFAQMPIDAAAIDLAALAIPSYLLRWSSHILLGRGRLGPFSILRSDLRSLGVDLMPFGKVRAEANRAGLSAVVIAVLVLDIAVVVAAVSMWRDWATRLSAGVAAVALVITAVFLGVAMEVLLDAMARRQRRTNHRVRLGLVTCRIEEHDGQLVDLSIGGAGVVVPAEPEQTLEVGTVTTLSFRIPDADGAWRSVSALVHVAHRARDAEGGTRLGLSFDDPTDTPLDPVIEFLTIDRRLVALGRHESVAH